MAAASTSPQSTGTAESAISFEPPGMGKTRTPLEMTHLEVCRSLSLSLSEMSLKNLVCRRVCGIVIFRKKAKKNAPIRR